MARTSRRRRGATASVTSIDEKRSNDTHASTTDPQAKLYKKGRGKEAKLCFMGHALMENRHGLVVQAEATEADGTAERKAALEMIDRQAPGTSNRLTLGADKAYDAREFVADLRQKCVTPHVAQKTRSSAIDGRTTRHTGYAVSSEETQARRGGLRLGQDHRRLRQGQGARLGAGRIPLHAGNGSLQPDPPAQTDRPGRVKRPLGGARPTPRSSPKARQNNPQAIRFRSDSNFNGLISTAC